MLHGQLLQLLAVRQDGGAAGLPLRLTIFSGLVLQGRLEKEPLLHHQSGGSLPVPCRGQKASRWSASEPATLLESRPQPRRHLRRG